MKGGGESGGVGIPRHHVERRRVVPQEIVADPIVPDEIVGAERGEDPGQGASLQRARPLGGPDRVADDLGAPEHADHGRDVVVHLGDGEGRRAHQAPADRGQMAQHARRGEAARTDTDHAERVAPADLCRRIHGLFERTHVGVEVPVPLSPGRVTPADGVDLETPARRVLHEAAAGREVHDVVLVDLRGDHHDGGLPHHRRRGRVLQQLEDLVAKDDRPGRGGQVPSHLEHAGWHGPWHTVVVHDVLRERCAARGRCSSRPSRRRAHRRRD